MTERTMPAGLCDERGLLDGWLDYYRATLLAKCDGLSGEQIRLRLVDPPYPQAFIYAERIGRSGSPAFCFLLVAVGVRRVT